MNKLFYFLAILFVSCNNGKEIKNNFRTELINKTQQSTAKENTIKEACWIGTVGSNIPVFMHYILKDSLFIGEITYLNTKNKKPIKLLGDIHDDADSIYRLLEFDPTGNITGVIEGLPSKNRFKGTWYAIKSEKKLPLSLVAKDTIVNSDTSKPSKDEIVGEYDYQYGEKGFNGEFDIEKVDSNRIAFYLISLTNVERGPNIAEVDKDTIQMTGNSFTYTIAESDSCGFKATFYKGFVSINYTHGYCLGGEFGLNATIDGIYLKTK